MRYTCTRTMPFITLLKCHYNIYCVPFPHFWLFVYTLHLFFCNLLFFVVMCVVALCKLVNNDAHTHTHTHTHTHSAFTLTNSVRAAEIPIKYVMAPPGLSLTPHSSPHTPHTPTLTPHTPTLTPHSSSTLTSHPQPLHDTK